MPPRKVQAAGWRRMQSIQSPPGSPGGPGRLSAAWRGPRPVPRLHPGGGVNGPRGDVCRRAPDAGIPGRPVAARAARHAVRAARLLRRGPASPVHQHRRADAVPAALGCQPAAFDLPWRRVRAAAARRDADARRAAHRPGALAAAARVPGHVHPRSPARRRRRAVGGARQPAAGGMGRGGMGAGQRGAVGAGRAGVPAARGQAQLRSARCRRAAGGPARRPGGAAAAAADGRGGRDRRRQPRPPGRALPR